MKKILSILLALVLCLPLCACGEKKDTAREQLTDLERNLFDALIAISTKSFYEPAAVRVLEVCDYEERSQHLQDKDSKYGYIRHNYELNYGPDTVVVRLQGENKVGGTLNHYYLICVKAGENDSEDANYIIERYSNSSNTADRLKVMKYKAVFGEYVELGDEYTADENASHLFNIGRINKAIQEYWEEMGF